MTLGPLTFLAPLALLGLLALPLVWWLLRVTPPSPKRQPFPPLRILQDVITDEETPDSTPLWLLLFRLLMVALIAIALARPVFLAPETETNRPLVLIIDDGWDTATNWNAAIEEAENLVTEARRKNFEVMLATTVAPAEMPIFAPAEEALRAIKSLSPKALPPAHSDVATALDNTDITGANAVWLSGSILTAGTDELAIALNTAAHSKRLVPADEAKPLLPGDIEETANGFRSVWHRLDTRSPRTTEITALGRDGQVLARGDISFAPGESRTEVKFELPAELRNRVSLLRPSDSASAGSVRLLDDSWGRPLVGIITAARDSGSPLLSEPFYTRTALTPYADLFTGSLDELLTVNPGVIVMPDEARTDTPELRQYVEDGGLLIRFSGPKVAKRPDNLLPVRLRGEGREFGGALTWEDPQMLAPFESNSPFFGLPIPEDVTVTRQIMAEPGARTDAHTWARLQDGSPIVTSSTFGNGRIVLFHVTAGPEWSNLAIGGLYVDMLRRMLEMARSTPSRSSDGSGNWAPERVLTGFGHLTNPGIDARPIPEAELIDTEISRQTPPGLYRQGARRRALNVVKDPESLKDIGKLPGVLTDTYGQTEKRSLRGILLALALLMLGIDALFALFVSGRQVNLRPRRIHEKIIPLMLVSIFIAPLPSHAAEAGYDPEALELHLAYIKTGHSGTDSLSEAAMLGLVDALNRRTTIEPVGVRGVDPETDPLVYYPFLYFPVKRDASALSDVASAALNDYMAGAGTIVFDTQDAGDQSFLEGTTHPGLARITENLDIPRLIEVPEDHVLTKSFYLIQVFPGRWANGQVWVDRNVNGAARDGVSSVIIGSNNWAAGWAQDDDNQPLVDLERDIVNQREMSLRFGVNLAMYALAGNYKSDQVHAAALVERLGRQELQPRNPGPSPRNGDNE